MLSTLTPSEYVQFRDKLGQASGFQSYQYRMIEFALGYKTRHVLEIYKKDPNLHQALSEALRKPSIYDVSIKAFEAGKKYPEKEINEYIKQFHEDFATIRREFIVNQIMYREDGIYELNPKELWAKID